MSVKDYYILCVTLIMLKMFWGKNLNTEQIEQYTNYVEKNLHRQIIRDVAILKTTFEEEVMKFYGLSESLEWGMHPLMDPWKEAPFKNAKKGKIPEELTDILKNFSEKPLNIEKLEYSLVRKDCEIIFGPYQIIKFAGIIFGAVAGSLGLILSIAEYVNSKKLDAAIPLALMSVAGYFMYIRASFSNTPKGYNQSLNEYLELKSVASFADDFIRYDYRKKMATDIITKISLEKII